MMKKKPNQPHPKEYVIKFGEVETTVKINDVSIYSADESMQEAATRAIEGFAEADDSIALHPFTVVCEKGDEDNDKKRYAYNTCRLLANCGFHDLSQRLREAIRIDHPGIDTDYDTLK